MSPKKVAFLLANIDCGGIQRVAINLLEPWSESADFSCQLVLAWGQGSYLSEIPPNVRVIDLKTPLEGRLKSLIKFLPILIKYFREEKPDIVLANIPIANFMTIIAKFFSGTRSRIILVEHTLFFNRMMAQELSTRSEQGTISPGKKWQFLPTILPYLLRWCYRQADTVVAVSGGIAREIEQDLRWQPGSVKVIYNPVTERRFFSLSEEPLNYPWFQNADVPVFLAVGRLVPQKDYGTLLRAFAQVRAVREARLLILGEGPSRAELEALIEELDIGSDVGVPGFVSNPYPYMRQAEALVLSSVWEGLPTVLIEALASGCQVVSTRCPHGPDEILAEGEYGWLVPMGEATALARGMMQALDFPKDRQVLQARGLEFSVEKALIQYQQLIINSSR